MESVGPDVDSYLAALPAEQRAALEKLRRAIRAAAPSAEERISYQIPTYRQNGHLVAFGAWKDHCALYVISDAVMEAHRNELNPYDTSKSTAASPPASRCRSRS